MIGDIWLLLAEPPCSCCSPGCSPRPTPPSGASRAPAPRSSRPRAPRGHPPLKILDDPARYLNTALLLRLLCETSAIVLVSRGSTTSSKGRSWPASLTAIGAMLVVSFVAIGVAPRTIGRQHDARVAPLSAGPLIVGDHDPRPASPRC